MSDTITTPDLFEIYSKAANLIEAKGWVQEKAISSRDEHCPTAAVNEVAGRPLNDLSTDLFEPFAAWLRANRADQIVPDPGYAVHAEDCETCRSARGRSFIQNWNDRAGRTKEEVLSALRDFAVTAVTNPGEEK